MEMLQSSYRGWALAAVCIAVAAGLFWKLSGSTLADDTRRQSDVARDRSLEPGGAPRSSPEAAQPRTAPDRLSVTVEQTLAQAGYWPPITSADARDEWARRDVVQRLLTPTSIADLEWMRRNAYPKRSDVETPNVPALDNLLQTGDPRTDRDRMNYAANALAAHYFGLDDPRWRDYVERSSGAFPAMLKVIDAARSWDKARDQEATSSLIRALAAAQYYGEVDVTDMFIGFRGGALQAGIPEMTSAWSSAARQNQAVNAAGARIGITPFWPMPRPAPPWSNPACGTGNRPC